jgi:transcriptional regulator with XRE-family HTH domain/DNA-binding XRE family transcriptional regulator
MSHFSRGVFDVCKEGGPGLKRFREYHGIELSALAQLTGLGEDTFYLAETGHTAITAEIVWAYIEAYKQRLHGLVLLPAPQARLARRFGLLKNTLSLIGSLLRAIRERHGSSLSAVATRFNLTAMALDKVELGKTIPRQRTVSAYAALLQEVLAAPPLPDEARELLVFIRAGLARLSRAELTMRAGVVADDIRRLEQHGQYQPGNITAYRQVLLQFRNDQLHQKHLFPADLIEFRKEHGVTLGAVGERLEMTESGVFRMETRPREKPLTVKEVWAYVEAAYSEKGVV